MNKLAKLGTVAAAAALVTVGMARAQEKPEALAQKSAEAWLALTDGGKYAQSWSAASASFKSQIGKEKWVETAQKVRTPLGKLKSRKLEVARYTKDIPNAPAGEYVIIEYSSAFANLPSATETVVPVLDKDGSWRVSGYFIKPKD